MLPDCGMAAQRLEKQEEEEEEEEEVSEEVVVGSLLENEARHAEARGS